MTKQIYEPIMNQYSIFVPLSLQSSHCLREHRVFHLSDRLCEFIGSIFVGVYRGVDDNLARMEISTVMAAHIDVLHPGLDHSGCDMCEGTLNVTVAQ